MLSNPFRRNHCPAFHRLASDVHRFDVRFLKQFGGSPLTDAGNQPLLIHAHAHVAIQQPADAAEHFLLRETIPALQQVDQTLGENWIVSHWVSYWC